MGVKLKRGVSIFLASIISITYPLSVWGIDTSSEIFTYSDQGDSYMVMALTDNYQDILNGTTEITLPDTYEGKVCDSVNASIFNSNNYFTKVTLPSTYKATNTALFKNCVTLKEVAFENVETFRISTTTFSGCTSLEKLYIYANSLESPTNKTVFTNVPVTAVAYVKNETVKNQLTNWPGSIIVDPSIGGGDSVDYTSLDTAIADGEAIDSSKYTAESYAVLTAALGTAKTVKENAAATQEEVDAAAKAITDAIAALKEAPVEIKWTGSFDRASGLATTDITGMTVKKGSGYMTFSGVDLSGMADPYVEVAFDANGSDDTLYVATSAWKTIIGSSTDALAKASLADVKSTTSFIVTTNNKSGSFGKITSVRFYDAAVSQKTVVATYEIGAENASDVIATLYDDGSMVISGTGAMKDYSSSSSQSAPWNQDGNISQITSIEVQNGVTTIGKYAFRNCTTVTSITLAESVTTIGSSAFNGCTNENLTVDVKGASVSCNSGCFGLSTSPVVGTIYVYDSTTFANVSSKATKANVVFVGELPISGKAGENATYTYDKDSKTLTISGTGSISEDLSIFAGSTEKLIIEDGLTSVSTSVGINNFTNAVITAPTSGTFDSDNSNWSYNSETKTLTLTKNKSTNLSRDTTSLMNLYKDQAENIVISDKFSRITSNAIEDYTALKTLTIPSSVSTIDSNGVKNCGDENTVIYIDADYKIKIDSKAFSGTKGTLSVLTTSILNSILQLDLSNKIVYRGEKLTSGKAGNMISWTWDDATKTLTFSGTGKMYDSVNNLEKLTYYGLYINEAENVIIGEGIENLTGIAFKNYKALKSVSVPSTVTDLGNYGFSGCSNEDLIIDIKSLNPYVNINNTFKDFVGTVIVYNQNCYDAIKGDKQFASGIAKLELKEPVIVPPEPSKNVYTWTGNWTKQTGLVDAGAASGMTVANTGGGWQMLIKDVDISSMVEPVIVVMGDTDKIQIWYGTKLSGASQIATSANSGAAVDLKNYKSQTEFTLSVNDPVGSITSIRIYDKANKQELDYTALNKAVADAEAIDTDKYTSYSVSVLTSAVESEKAILADENATQESIGIAAKKINDAIAALKDKSYEANYIVKVEKSGAEAILDTFKADDSTAGAVKVKITFDCAEDVNFNKYANIEVKAVVNGTETYQKIIGTGEESEAVKGEQGIEIELPLTNAIASGNDVKLSAYTWCFSHAVDYVYGITKVEYINEDGEVVRTIPNATISLNELKTAIANAEAVDTSLYTNESVTGLLKAIESAKAVIENAYATQDDVDNAIKAITDAISGLKLKPIVTTGTVTGTIKVSDKNAETEMTILAVSSDGTKTTVKATSMGTYTIENLEAGSYTLTISGGKYAERSYEITVSEGENALDVELNPLGDINGDGKVTTADVGMANSHAKGVITLTDYGFVCANVKSDESITTADVGMINSHAKGVTALW